MKALDQIVGAQQAWALRRWPGHTGLRAPTLDDNLIVPIRSEVRSEYEKGGGNELGTGGRLGKMYSLRSSSALTYNFFAPWRGRNFEPLAAALDTMITDNTLAFEYKCSHGLSSGVPNLDVALDIYQPRPLGIECKFTEPYDVPPEGFSPLKPAYLLMGALVGQIWGWQTVSRSLQV